MAFTKSPSTCFVWAPRARTCPHAHYSLLTTYDSLRITHYSLPLSAEFVLLDVKRLHAGPLP